MNAQCALDVYIILVYGREQLSSKTFHMPFAATGTPAVSFARCIVWFYGFGGMCVILLLSAFTGMTVYFFGLGDTGDDGLVDMFEWFMSCTLLIVALLPLYASIALPDVCASAWTTFSLHPLPILAQRLVDSSSSSITRERKSRRLVAETTSSFAS
jgi:hypothetical protein